MRRGKPACCRPGPHAWLAKKLDELHRVFTDRIRELDAAGWQAGGKRRS